MTVLNTIFTFPFPFGLACSCSYLTLLLFIYSVSSLELFGMVKALEIVFAEKRAVLGFSATRHTFAEISPEIIAPPFAPCNPPT